MNSPGTRSSPTYKNLKIRNKQSPIEIKEKLRKSYREKVSSCRSLLINSFRGAAIENEVKITLNEIYKKTFNFDEDISSVEDEQMLDEIRKELVKEELDWWLEEYERCQNYNIDWSSIEAESVICPVCEKANLIFRNGEFSCSTCNILVKTEKCIADVKSMLFNSVDKHSSLCDSVVQFTAIPDVNGTHIYLICSACNDMQLII
ncbi:hypothetical protein JYU34_007404 [Plutella xylostella]|uniref:RPA-interacting protein C-terminal domain-containing protein n=2 Tax=Plutella xylostella TaxID=51655 RepID=A0ABQ7QQC6_PLUXY|nr:hypothetical protein JYU34_007404 [Plutella xylostella]